MKAFHFRKLNNKREWGKTTNRKRKRSVMVKHDLMRDAIKEYDELDEFQKQSQLFLHLSKLSKIRKEYFEKDYDQFTDSDNSSDSDSE